MTAAGTYLHLETEDTIYEIEPVHKDSIDAAVSHYLDTGRDALLHLTTIPGMEVTLRASSCTAWWVSTPSVRKVIFRNEMAREMERDTARREIDWGGGETS